MIVKIIPGNCYEVSSTNDIDLTIVFVRTTSAAIGFEFVVIDAHACGVLNRHSIIVQNSADFQILDYHIGDMLDVDTIGRKNTTRSCADDGRI